MLKGILLGALAVAPVTPQTAKDEAVGRILQPYAAYIYCVAEKSYMFSKGPDTAESIAVAALQTCEDDKSKADRASRTLLEAYNRGLPLTDQINPPTYDVIMKMMDNKTRSMSISVVVRNRAVTP
jgi:hypothetical protein